MSNFQYTKSVAIDFDGTIVKHSYPAIGDPVPLAIDCIKLMQELGYETYLNTMRSGVHLQAAIDYLSLHGIKMDGYNENPSQKAWTSSPKVHADVFIDDRGYGTPLCYEKGEMYVDWQPILKDLKNKKK